MATMVYAASAAFGALDVFALNLSESYFEQPSAAAMAKANDTEQWGNELSCDATLLPSDALNTHAHRVGSSLLASVFIR